MQLVSSNKKALLLLDEKLLNKLTTATGSLIEDTELVEVLNYTKTKSKEVAQVLNISETKT